MNRVRIAIHEKLNHHSKSNKLASYLIEFDSHHKMKGEKVRLGIDSNDHDESTTTNEVNKCDSNDWTVLNNLKIDQLAEANDCLILCLGNLSCLREVVGKVRNSIIPLLLNDSQVRTANALDNDKYSFLWVENFPLFLKEEDDVIDSHHHPFTAPIDEHLKLIYEDPLKVIGQHYDLVLNGNEVGGGSIRIHDYKLQKYVFESILKSDVSQMDYFLNALRTGCPPHGGIALGLDRLISLMLNTESIRDVIAFPKTTNGRCVMSEAPNELSKETKSFYHLN